MVCLITGWSFFWSAKFALHSAVCMDKHMAHTVFSCTQQINPPVHFCCADFFFCFLVWLICGLVTFGQMFIESHIPDLIVGWPLTGKNTIWKYMVYICMYINYNVIVKLAYLSLMFDRCIPNTGCSANGGGYLRWCKRSVQNQDKSWIGHNERP